MMGELDGKWPRDKGAKWEPCWTAGAGFRLLSRPCHRGDREDMPRSRLLLSSPESFGWYSLYLAYMSQNRHSWRTWFWGDCLYYV